MHRFYLPPEQCNQHELRLEGREAHHAAHVLRLRKGERVVVMDGAGHEFLCEVLELARDRVGLGVKQVNHLAPLPYAVTLLQAIPRGKLMDAIVQKATELGVSRIVPLLSERVVSHLGPESSGAKAGKWENTAIEALKQCGAPWLPRVETPVTLKNFLARSERFELSLIASLQPGALHPRQVFAGFCSEHGHLPRSVCIWVGPEGDFTPAEVAEVRASGAASITLGRQILRSETAAIYCLSILNYELQSPRLEQHPKAAPQK